MGQLRADCELLRKIGVMDYSLLLGIHFPAKMAQLIKASGGLPEGGPSAQPSTLSSPASNVTPRAGLPGSNGAMLHSELATAARHRAALLQAQMQLHHRRTSDEAVNTGVLGQPPLEPSASLHKSPFATASWAAAAGAAGPDGAPVQGSAVAAFAFHNHGHMAVADSEPFELPLHLQSLQQAHAAASQAASQPSQPSSPARCQAPSPLQQHSPSQHYMATGMPGLPPLVPRRSSLDSTSTSQQHTNEDPPVILPAPGSQPVTPNTAASATQRSSRRPTASDADEGAATPVMPGSARLSENGVRGLATLGFAVPEERVEVQVGGAAAACLHACMPACGAGVPHGAVCVQLPCRGRSVRALAAKAHHAAQQHTHYRLEAPAPAPAPALSCSSPARAPHPLQPLQASPDPGMDKACNFETFSGQAELEERLRQIEDRMQQLGWGAQRIADVLGLARWGWPGGGVVCGMLGLGLGCCSAGGGTCCTPG